MEDLRRLEALVEQQVGALTGKLYSATADWKKLAGIARIRRYVPGGGAAGYLAKVYSRDGRGEIDVGGDWTKLRRR